MVVRELFMSGGCMEAYIYPLYGVTMATRVKVRRETVYILSLIPVFPKKGGWNEARMKRRNLRS